MEKPILLGVDGQAREIIERYKCGIFFEPENEKSFSNAIQQIQDEQTQKRLKLGCREFVQDYDRNFLADQMLKILVSNLD